MPQRFGLRDAGPTLETPVGRLLKAVAAGCVLALLYLLSRDNYPTFHTLVEVASISLTWSVTLLLWNARRFQDIDAYLTLGLALFLAGAVDLLHTASYEGINVFGQPHDPNIATQFWIIARTVEAVGWLGFAFLAARRRSLVVIMTITGAMAVSGVALVLGSDAFPVCFVAGRGLTGFKVGAEFVLVAVLVAALIVFRRRSGGTDAGVRRRLSWSLALVAVAELAFVTYNDTYGLTNMAGHLIRIVSRYLLYLGLVELAVARPYALFFQRLQAEKDEIAASEERWRLLSQTNPDHILDLDADLRIRFANYPSPGLAFDDILGRSILDFLTPDDVARVEPLLRTALGSAEPVRYETLYEGPDGEVIHYETTAIGGPAPNGSGRRLTLVARNVTERKRAEARLAETERQLSGVLANLPGMVFRCANDDDWTMHFCSEGCHDLTGCEADDLVGNRVVSYASLIVPEDQDHVARVVRDGLDHDERYQVTYRILPRGGDEKWVWEQGRGDFRDGELVAIEGFIYDITAQVHAEEERRGLEKKVLASQKLESLGVMAGGIAHDFNNLLQMIVGFGEIAAAETGPDHSAAAALADMLRAAGRAADLTRQMLAFAGRGKLTMRDIDVAGELAGMAPLLVGAVPKSIEFHQDHPPRLHLATIDETQLHQVALNLVRNAAEAVGDGPGEVTLRSGQGIFTAAELATSVAGEHPDGAPARPGEYVFLEVTDNGCGMDEATRARICEPFYSTKFVGRGLGMAAVQGIVRGHRGALFIDSVPGQGTTVRVLFPSLGRYAPDAAAGGDGDSAPAPAPAGALPDQGGFVLVVDDEPDVCRAAATGLAFAGYRVVTVANGREAVATVARRGDEVLAVLLDVVMPAMGGEECLRRIRADHPELPVVIMSGWTEVELAERFAGQRYDAILPKPFRAEALLRVLQQVLPATDRA
ncbi:PAS domain S-box protein [bacterium]|nr:PAS domain S-box protein [bacterium]